MTTTKRNYFGKTGLLACLLTTCLYTTADAQPPIVPIPPSLSEKPLAPTPNGMATINSAMMECPNYGGTFAAVTVSDFNSTNLYLNFGNGTVTSSPIPITGAPWALADVTIGDDINAPGDRYIVAVSYRELISTSPLLYDIWVRTFVVDDLSGAMNIAPNPPEWLGTGNNPKIDIMADENNMIGPHPAMHQFTMVYTSAPGTVQLYTREIDFSAPANAFPVSMGSDYQATDVAVIKDLNTGGTPIACVSTLSNSNSDLEVWEVDLNSTAVMNVTPLQNGLTTYYPRIEAFGIYDASYGAAKWAVTTTDFIQKIMLYTNLTAPYQANPQPYFSTSSQEYPALASGIGPVFGSMSNMGNTQYTYAWGAPQHFKYYSQALDLAGNPVNPLDFHEVNNAPCNMISDPPEMITLCNSSNSGTDLFIAWNEGARIMYKQTGNTFGYKPTGIEDAQSLESLSIAPNPAQNHITIRSSQDVNRLTIMNSIGARVKYLDLKPGETTVDISGLAAGTYFLHISGKDGNTTKPLVIAR